MIVPGSVNPLLLASGAGYQIQNSLRFRWSNTGYLSRTAGASPTNDKIFTWAGWVKLGLPVTSAADYGVLFSGYTASSDAGFAVLTVSNVIAGFPVIRIGGWATNWRVTSAAFRDPSAWYHIVMAIDTTQATAADRIKLYVNGTQITSFGTSNNPALNATMGFNNASSAQRIGLDAPASSAFHFDGYMANVYFVDGQALTPASFGQTDATTGLWVPKPYSGTYGNNGFFLQFRDATSTTTIGYDTSGNSNNFTTSGISVTAGGTFDQMTDTPTLNYPVISPLNSQSLVSITEAGMASSYAGVTNTGTCIVSVPFPTTGKWYYEHTCIATGASDYWLGVFTNKSIAGNFGNIIAVGTNAGEYSYRFNGQKMIAGVASAYGASYTANDVIGVAFDATNLTIEFFKNGTSQGQLTGMPSGEYIAFTEQYNGGSTRINFGQRPFAYTPPTGFKALNTANLTEPSIKKPSLYMDATLRTGTGATASVSSLGFQPDLVWIKSRSAATNHNMFDSGRGVQKGLGTNWSGAQYTDANTLTAFNSNGYSLGSDASSRGVNVNTATYVDWAWKKGATPGFDVVTYTGNATNRTIAHGLGVVPEMMLIRNYDWASTQVMVAYHSRLNNGTTPANYYLYTTSTAAEAATAAFFNNTMPTSSVFTVGTDTFVNRSGDGHVAYLFASVEGFSKFGSYVGNGSTDGPFVWCGFRPRFILLKDRNNVAYWIMVDTVRNTFNVISDELLTNTADAENGLAITTAIDATASGFKIRTSDANINFSADNYIFAAFAEAPFKYARAR